MAIINKVEKKSKLPLWDAVKYQLLTHCYLENIPVSNADLDCLTSLAISGPQELTGFCSSCSEKKIFKSSQSARNALSKVEKKQLIIKEGKNKKKIRINPELKIQTEGNVLLDFKFLALATN